MYRLTSLVLFVIFVVSGGIFLQVRGETAGNATASKEVSASKEKTFISSPADSTKVAAATGEPSLSVDLGDAVALKKIEQVLDGPLHPAGMSYKDQPLQNVVTQLEDEYKIPIRVNRQALEEAGIGSDVPTTANLQNVSLRSALALILQTHQLTWIIKDEVLMITTKEDAEKDLVVSVYNIQGLVDETDTKSIDSLIDTIVSCVSTDTWAENGGGQAEIRPLQPGLLVISQTQEVHRQIKGLLAQIRKMREQVPVVKGLPQMSGRNRGGRSSPSTPDSKTAEPPKHDDSNTHKDPAKK